MKGRRVLPVSALLFSTVLFFGQLGADTSPASNCHALFAEAPAEDNLTNRLACYNSELDGISVLIGTLLKEREQLSDLLNASETNAVTKDRGTEHLQTIERLRTERSELSAQLHLQLLKNQEITLARESEERLLRNYSQAYLSLAEKNSELGARIKSVTQRLADQDSRVKSLDNANGTLSKDVKQLARQNKKHTATIAKLTASNIQLNKTLNARKSTARKLRAQLIANATLSAQLSETVSVLQQRLEEMQHANAIKGRDIAHLNRAASVFATGQRNEKASLIANIEALQQDISNLEADKISLTENAESAAIIFTSEIAERAAKLNTLTKNFAALQKDLTDANDELDNVRQKRAIAIAASGAFLDTNTNLRKYSSEVNGQLVKFKSEVALQASAIDALEKELTTLKTTRDALNAQLQGADQLIADQKESLSALTNEIQDKQQHELVLNRAIANLNSQLASTLTELNRAHAETREQRRELELNREELASKENISASTEQKLADAIARIRELESQNEDLESQLSVLNTKAMDQQHELSDARQQQNKVTQMHAVAVAASDALSATNATLRQRLSSMNAELSESTANAEMLRKTTADLQQDKILAVEELNSLREKVTTLEAVLEQSRLDNEQFAVSLTTIKSALSDSNDRFSTQQAKLQSLMREKESIVAELNSARIETLQLTDTISNQLISQGQRETVSVDTLPDNTIRLRIASRQLYRKGSSVLNEEGRLLLEKIALVLADTSERRILIEGHSDNLPLGPKLTKVFRDNFGLSMARATSAANFLAENTPVPAHQLSISGAGDTRPVATNTTESGRQQNRRVELLLLP